MDISFWHRGNVEKYVFGIWQIGGHTFPAVFCMGEISGYTFLAWGKYVKTRFCIWKISEHTFSTVFGMWEICAKHVFCLWEIGGHTFSAVFGMGEICEKQVFLHMENTWTYVFGTGEMWTNTFLAYGK